MLFRSIWISDLAWKKIEKSNGVNKNVLRGRHLPDIANPVLIFFTPRAIAPRPFKLGSPNLAVFHEKSPSTKWLSQKTKNGRHGAFPDAQFSKINLGNFPLS